MRLHVHDSGDEGAPAIVCLHGVGDTGSMFAPLAARLPEFRLRAPDLRGHGASGREPPWDVETHVADVLETLGDVRACAWVGFSFGGRMAIELAAREPERVERLVLLDPAIRIRPERALELAEQELAHAHPDYSQVAAIGMLGALAGRHAPVADVRAATLLVVPQDDAVTGPRQVAWFREHAQCALDVVRVLGGHNCLSDAFEPTAAAIADFLR